MRRRGSLAAQLQPRVALLVAVMALLVCVTTVFAAHSLLYSQLDAELDGAQARQGRGVSSPGGGIVPGIDTPGMRVGTVVAIRFGDGSGIARVVGEGRIDAITADALAQLVSIPADDGKHTVDLGGMGRYRVESRQNRLGTVSVGLPTRDVDRAVLWLGLLTATAGAVAVAGAAVVTRRLVQQATRPLVALTDTAADVAQMELSRGAVAVPRVASEPLPEDNEVTRLSAAFNHMLGRVEHAITEREASEGKLRRFVADASHELRNPLAAIRGYAELAQRSPDGTGRALERIGAESQRMTKLVNDLLMLARLDSDATVALRPVDAVEVVLNAVSDAQAASRDHQWRLSLPDGEVPVLADPDQLQQVLVNLLSNARTHTPPGTTVTASVGVEGPQAVIRVVDDGPGIPPEALGRVFERFVRADDARAHSSANSTGLGLAIVRAVVESFGGEASVESTPGRTVFTVRLRRAGS